jgi:hypothetical protein
VHAFVRGEYIHDDVPNDMELITKLSYDPYEDEGFMVNMGGETKYIIAKALGMFINDNGIFAHRAIV